MRRARLVRGGPWALPARPLRSNCAPGHAAATTFSLPCRLGKRGEGRGAGKGRRGEERRGEERRGRRGKERRGKESRKERKGEERRGGGKRGDCRLLVNYGIVISGGISGHVAIKISTAIASRAITITS